MHRVAALAAVLALGVPLAHADDAPKRLSVDVSFGLRPDMAALGSTIAQDGTIDVADTSMASLVYSTGKALMSDRNNMAIYHNSRSTNSSFQLLGEEPEVGGALLGMDFGAS